MDPITPGAVKASARALDTGSFIYENRFGIIAHRGDRITAVENTLKAIDNAGRLGYEVVELDVRKTSDGHYVLMHDATVDRTTDGTGKVAEMTLAEIRALVVDEPYAGKAGSDEVLRVPTFAEACAQCRRWGLGINLDGGKLKWTEEDLRAVTDIMAAYGLIRRSFVVMTNPDYRNLLHRVRPDIAVTWLTSDTDPANNIREVEKYTNAFVAYPHSVIQANPGLVEEYMKRGIPVFVHSCNTIHDVYVYKRLGVRFVETDTILPGGII